MPTFLQAKLNSTNIQSENIICNNKTKERKSKKKNSTLNRKVSFIEKHLLLNFHEQHIIFRHTHKHTPFLFRATFLIQKKYLFNKTLQLDSWAQCLHVNFQKTKIKLMSFSILVRIRQETPCDKKYQHLYV